jgi:hypothetical protein
MIFETKEEISLLLEKNLEIDPKRKDDFGEVNTPEELIHQMLDKLPQNIWKDPNQKWLDPASGIGSFQMIVYEKLIKSLESWEPNLQKRHDHIIQNMIYMCEINRKNIKTARKIFGEKSNIIKGDFLKIPFHIKFDVIIGNPPFNDSQDAKNKKGGGNSLWPDFVEKSLDLLKENGYLVFVHPSGWRKPESEETSKTHNLFKKMTRESQIEYLEIHTKADGVKTFGVQTRYDWYVLRKTKCYKKTVIKDETGKHYKINLLKWDFLPNCYYSEVKKLLSNDNVDVIYSRNQFGTDKEWTNETESIEYKYPLIHSTPIGEPRFYWTNTKTPPVKNPVEMFGEKKVIFGESGINDVVLDNTGKYGMTQGAIGIKIYGEKHGFDLKKALESKGFERIIKAMNFGNFRIDWRIFLYFRKDFYKFFLEKGENSKKTKKTKKNDKTKNKKTLKKSSASKIHTL